jgi:hypothetical protein
MEALSETDQSLESSCRLIAGLFATMLQVGIGCFAGLSLLYKHYFVESPRRSFDIWMMDISKQGFASVLIHFWNIAQSILFSKLSTKKNPSAESDECANYFMYFVLDTFLGVYFVYIQLLIIHELALRYGIRSLKTQGYYGTPRQMRWYIHQLVCFLAVVIVSKSILGLLMFVLSTPADMIGSIIFEPFHHMNPNVELVFVMVVCPFFLNIIQVCLDH